LSGYKLSARKWVMWLGFACWYRVRGSVARPGIPISWIRYVIHFRAVGGGTIRFTSRILAHLRGFTRERGSTSQ